MKSKPVFDLEVDATRNLVRLRYCGNVTAVEMQACARQAGALMPQMKVGFTVLVDLSGLENMALDCVPYLSKIMDLCKAQGVGLVVRVIPDPTKDIGLNILSLIHYRGKVRIVTCDTLAEAEKLMK
jgi:ABC-type transporter Mla MlaB component